MCAIATVVTEAVDVYCADSDSKKYASVYVS